MKRKWRITWILIAILQAVSPVYAENEPSPAPAENTVQENETADTEESVQTESVSVSKPEQIAVSEEMDLHETAFHAASRLNPDAAGKSRGLLRDSMDTVQLISGGRIAQIPKPSGEGTEYISLFTLNGKAAYCAEPEVLVLLNGSSGPMYSSDLWQNVRPEDALSVKRIAWYGYGHPMTGTSYDAYIATQLLIWKIVAPEYYEKLNAGMQLCGEPHFDYPSCTFGRGNVDALMESIEDLAYRHDTVPSFANEWHQTASYQVEWDQTLVLEDTRGVLNWFQQDSEESHNGIHIKIQKNRLLADIDDLYYEGWNTVSGKTLTFRRDPSQWENMMNGILIYTSGVNQKLFAETGDDPTPSYQLSFKLNTGDTEVTKLNEYYEAGQLTAGTEFMAAWQKDPETQYQKDGSADMEWTEYHDAERKTKDDQDGLGGRKDGRDFYYPVMNEDGSSIRTWAVGSDGILHIDGFLPSNQKWWLKEVKATHPYILNPSVFSASTGRNGSTSFMAFVNALRDVTLNLVKQDEENVYQKINGAKYQIYEIGNLDLSRTPTAYGTEINLNRMEEAPQISYSQLKENTDLKLNDRFTMNEWLFEIIGEEEKEFTVQARKLNAQERASVFTRYQLPENMQEGTAYEVRDTQRQHGTFSDSDDEVQIRKMRIEKIPGKEDPDYGKIILHETDSKENVLIAQDTSPSMQDFEEAAEEQNVQLRKDVKILVNRVPYVIRQVNDGSLLASPQTEYTVNLEDAQPAWTDLPDAENLKKEDRFTLTCPHTEDGIQFDRKSVEFTVVSADPFSIALESEGQRFTVPAPEWISCSDIPEKVMQRQQFTVSGIINPVYEVQDSRGNSYQVSDSGTLAQGDSAKASDISYLYLIGSTEEQEDGTFIEKPEGYQNGGACEQPYDAEGCPVSMQRVRQITVPEEITYEGIQYDELSDEQLNAQAEETFEQNGILYTVKEPGDSAAIVLSFVKDGKEYLVSLASGAAAVSAVHLETEEVTFTITGRKDKEYDLTWDTVSVPDNSLTADASIHLVHYAEEETQGDLQYSSFPDPSASAGSRITVNGTEYTVLFSDRIQQKMIVESSRGRYELTPESTVNITPVSYGKVRELESMRKSEAYPEGHAFIIGDVFENDYEKPSQAGDSFERDGIQYAYMKTEWAEDGSTETLQKDPEYVRRLGFCRQKNAPFSFQEITNQTAVSMDFESETGKWTIQTFQASDGSPAYLLEKETGETWEYYQADLIDLQNHDPQEQQERMHTMKVQKPSEITYEDYEEVRLQKKEGDIILFNGTEYRVLSLGSSIIRLEHVETAEILILDSEDPGSETLFKQYEKAVRILKPLDFFSAGSGNYQLIQETAEEHTGISLLVKNTETAETFTVKQFPDSPFYETEQIHFYSVNTEYDLSSQYPNAASIETEEGNPHVQIETVQEDEKQKFILTSDANTWAVLRIMDAEGNVTAKQKTVFTSEQAKTEEGLLVFQGETGRQYLRLMDSENHNMPLPFHQVSIYRDGECSEIIRTMHADETGTVDVSDLPAGTYYCRSPKPQDSILSFTVENTESMQGQLKAEGLKWGRRYLACEVSLPEGYDYGEQEVCHAFTLSADENTDTLSAEIENRLRRLDLRVYKVDSQDRSTLLNDAWFTVRDITDQDTVKEEQQASDLRSRLMISDIPENAEIGDTIPILRAKNGGEIHRYRIENISEQEIAVSLFDGNQPGQIYYVPIKGFSRTAPMLFCDIERALPSMKKGSVFEVQEKEDMDTLKLYRILSLERQETEDLFSRPSGKSVIVSASVYDTADTSHLPIQVKAVLSDERIGAEDLGMYVSGGILIREQDTDHSLDMDWEQLSQKLGSEEKILPGAVFQMTRRKTAQMPDYQTALKELKQPIQISDSFVYSGLTWTVSGTETDSLKLTAEGQEFILRPNTITGAVGYEAEETMTVAKLWKEEDGTADAVTYQNEQGNSWYLCRKDQNTETIIGKPGVLVQLKDPLDPETVLYEGYTGAAGQIVFHDLQEKDYSAEHGDQTELIHAGPGMIDLPEVKYGHQIEVCEVKSPLGYMTGNVCEVIVPEAELTEDTVRNYRSNTRIRKMKQVLQIRRMGTE